MASPKVQPLAFYFLLYINDLPTALGDSAFLFADDVKMVFPRSQSSHLLSSLFFRLGLGGEMAPTNQPQQMFMSHRWEPPSTFSAVLRGRHRPPNSPGPRRRRPRGSPRHDLHRASPLHRGCKYSKAFAVHGPKILL